MSLKLSQDQHEAIQGIISTFVSDIGKHALAVLTGSAGTGKSTVVEELINQLRINYPLSEITLCASTHCAASVLKSITKQKVHTAHTLFSLRPSVKSNGKQELIQLEGKCEIPLQSIIIIDEASMIGNDFLHAIVERVKDKALKILFVGDKYQLPPISSECAIFDGSLPTFTLNTIHRQGLNNPIIRKAHEYREFIDGTRSQFPVLETLINNEGEGITVLPHQQFVSKFVERYMDYDAGDEVDVPLCTYTNDSAINYNNMIRKAAYFLEDTIQPFYKNEILVSNSLVKNEDRVLLGNNEVVQVNSFKAGEFKNIQGYYVTINSVTAFHKGFNFVKTVFCPINKQATKKELSRLKDIAIKNRSKLDWVNYYNLQQSLADLRPPFASTTHKAQGGTFPAVFIDQLNINKCFDLTMKAKLMYVALTRASSNVYVNS